MTKVSNVESGIGLFPGSVQCLELYCQIPKLTESKANHELLAIGTGKGNVRSY